MTAALQATPTLRSIDVVAFDFDGTLADTNAAIVATVRGVFAAENLGPITREQILPFIGLPLGEFYASVGAARSQVSACIAHHRELFPSQVGLITLFSPIRPCLEQLAAQGFTLAVVSSRGRHSLLDLIERLDVGRYFAAVLGEEDAVNKKPAPDLVLNVAARFDVSPSRILVVGDTTYDIEMGHAAGARTCAVTYGNHDAARLATSRPHHQLDSLVALGALLDG